jgi:hypothetical protein
MMVLAFREFPAENIVALFDEPAGSDGEVHDINAPRNAPAKNPAAHLDKIYFHSNLDSMEVLADTTVSVAHALVPATSNGDTGSSGSNGSGTANQEGQPKYLASSINRTLYTHNLGYPPHCFALVDGKVLWPGMPVQTFAGGRGRYCSLYVTPTIVGLREWTSMSATDLPAISKDYRLLIIKQPPASPTDGKLFYLNPETGIVKVGRGRFSSDRRYLQVVPGGTPWSFPGGRMLDLKNGAPRFLMPDGTIYEPVPATARARMVVQYATGTYTGAWGALMNYNGSFVLPAQIKVQAP